MLVCKCALLSSGISSLHAAPLACITAQQRGKGARLFCGVGWPGDSSTFPISETLSYSAPSPSNPLKWHFSLCSVCVEKCQTPSWAMWFGALGSCSSVSFLFLSSPCWPVPLLTSLSQPEKPEQQPKAVNTSVMGSESPFKPVGVVHTYLQCSACSLFALWGISFLNVLTLLGLDTHWLHWGARSSPYLIMIWLCKFNFFSRWHSIYWTNHL